MNALIFIPIAYLMMLITNNKYFFQFNWNFSDSIKNKTKMDYSDYNLIWIAIYQLFRSLYYFALIGLSIWNIKIFPNIFFILFIVEFLKHFFRNRWWFLLTHLTGLIYILAFIIYNNTKI
jgi:hypothetical protein